MIPNVTAYTEIPMEELKGQSLTMKINYGFHLGVPKEKIIEQLGITNKRFIDVTWMYANGYKEKVVAFMEAQYLKKERKKNFVFSNEPVPYYELEDTSLTFKINYAHHLGIPKEEVIKKLGITNKRYIDVTWKYDNENYKQRIINFLESRKAA